MARGTVVILFIFFLCGTLLTVAKLPSRLYRLNEVNWGDSYIFYDIVHFQKTGLIYRDLSQPPYLPAIYSPLVYMIYAVPTHPWRDNPFLGPRLLALGAFVLCIWMVCSIVKVLVPVRGAWIWGMLLGASIHSMALWLGQLRADFIGIFFGLATVRLLLSRPRWVVSAGICAGLALQFKITYAAPALAGFLWLLMQKQWKPLMSFTAAAALFGAGPYLIFWLREPSMIPQMLGLSPAIWDPVGCLKLILRAMVEPVVLLALIAVPTVARRDWRRWTLLLLFAALSFTLGSLTDMQVGGNINYLYESLFALVPLAVLGIFKLTALTRMEPGLAFFTAALCLFVFSQPLLRDLQQYREEISLSALRARNNQFRRVAAALQGEHIFSTIPRMALLDPAPALTESYLLTYMQRMGKFNPKPVLDRVRKEEFDVVVTAPDPALDWRGIRRIAPDLESAIRANYQPYCIALENVLQLPRHRAIDTSLTTRLQQIGCRAYDPAAEASLW
jgi:hypothetical protein